MVNLVSEEEMKDLLMVTGAFGLSFAILFFGGSNRFRFLLSPELVPAFIASAALVGMSFMPHAIMHRATARAVEAYAEFKRWTPGLILSVLTSFLGFVFAAPGGVEEFTRTGERYGRHEAELAPRHIGIIAAVGPLMNIALASIFAFTAEFVSLPLLGKNLLVVGAQMNSWMAVSMLVPVFPLDGYKVLRWSPYVWGFGVMLAVLSFFLV